MVRTLVIDSDLSYRTIYNNLVSQELSVSVFERLDCEATENIQQYSVIVVDTYSKGTVFVDIVDKLISFGVSPGKIIVYTHDVSAEMMKRCMEKGVWDYLVKPLKKALLVERILNCAFNVAPSARTCKPRVLLVDDDTFEFERMAHILGKEYHLDTATSAHDAIDSIGRYAPDIALIDIAMGDVSGFELLEMIKSDKKTQSIPVICISSRNISQFKSLALSKGAIDYITKPYNVHYLKTKISNIVGQPYAGSRQAD